MLQGYVGVLLDFVNYFLNIFSVKTIALVRAYNQQFQGLFFNGL